MSQYIFTTNRLGKIVSQNKFILKDISLSFFPGAKIGVLGLNGSGKSTLLKIMAGEDKNFEGEARPQPGIKIGYLPQEPQMDPKKTVKEVVEEGVAEVLNLLKDFNQISDKFANPMSDDEMTKLLDQQGKIQESIDASNGWEVERRLEVAKHALSLPSWDTLTGILSGGEKRRVAICRLLLTNPDMLLLDEPTNHLDAQSVHWLEQFLSEYKGTVVAVTHDRYFLDNVAGWILELDRGEGIPWEGNYTSWLTQKDKRLEGEQKTEKSRQKAIKSELEWIRSNPKGRQAKSKARIARFEELNSEEFQTRSETNEIYIAPGPRLGSVVIEAKNVSKSFDEKNLLDNLNLSIPPASIVGIIGANGVGKSTLFKLIIDEEKPDSGTFAIGESVKIAYVNQSRDKLNDENTIWEEVSEKQDIIEVGTYKTPSRAYLGKFNFKGADQQKKIGLLSGGERNRVHLAKLLKSGGNVLLLDEPTNDLDVETLRALEEALLVFPGTCLVISHDRWFLNRIASHIIAFESSDEVTFIEGNYDDYCEDLIRRKGKEALKVSSPYTKLT